MKYSVVIPVFNSEKTIGKLIDELVIFFNKAQLDFEIILVNDGSEDESWNIIKNKIKLIQNICAIDLINNQARLISGLLK
jgi:undecaprenyl-phosphate 4-deoxy-4-formamido-L-arabinose transferase